MINTDILVVGTGFSRATVAESMAAEFDRKVLVLEKRDHISGNAYDTLNDNGLLMHPYGPHIFHANAVRVWEYLSRYTGWRPYEHKVLTQIDGKLVPVPFNLNSLHALFPTDAADYLQRLLIKQYGEGARVPILKMRENSDVDLQELVDYPYMLQGLKIDRPNQVWATDISYIPMPRGFAYVVAIMDLYSRKVLAWRVSNIMDADFCVDALEEVITRYGVPDIFYTDQGGAVDQ